MEQLKPLGSEFHNKRMQALSIGRKAAPGVKRPEINKNFQPFGPNPAEYEQKKQADYKPPKDDYKYKGPTRIGGTGITMVNMKTQITDLSKVDHDYAAKRSLEKREYKA